MSNHTCGHCGEAFTTLDKVAIHITECARSKHHACKNCPLRFDTAAELQRHDCSKQEPDAINPPHYKSSPARCDCGRTIECIDVVRWFNMNIGNVIKYLWRADHKGSRQEQLKKAHWYLRDEIRKQEPNFDANA